MIVNILQPAPSLAVSACFNLPSLRTILYQSHSLSLKKQSSVHIRASIHRILATYQFFRSLQLF